MDTWQHLRAVLLFSRNREQASVVTCRSIKFQQHLSPKCLGGFNSYQMCISRYEFETLNEFDKKNSEFQLWTYNLIRGHWHPRHKIDTLGGVFCFLGCPRTPKSQTGCPWGHPKILQGCLFYTQKKFRVSPVLVGPMALNFLLVKFFQIF